MQPNKACFPIAAASVFFSGGCLLLSLASAQDASVKTIFEKHDLLGIFAYDCGRPASKENLYFVDRVIDEAHVQRDAMSGQNIRDWVAIIDKAVELTPDRISVSGQRNGMPSEAVWRLEKSRMRAEESALGGKKLISGGKFTSNGQNSPWVNKCDAPGTQAQSASKALAESSGFPREAAQDRLLQIEDALLQFEQNVTWASVDESWRDQRDGWIAAVQAASTPESLAAQVLALEQAMGWQSVDNSWRARRDGWVGEMQSADSDAAVARGLLELEQATLWSAVTGDWRQLRDSWVAGLESIQ